MKKILLAVLLFSSFSLSAQVNKIEHFFASSPKAKELFMFFRDQFNLPVVWNFQEYTGFASGGLSLGNVVFEFVNYNGVSETRFSGIALEPKQDIDEFIKILDKKGIVHGQVDNNTHINDKGILVGWSNLGLQDLLPAEANFFICDYKERERISLYRKKAADSLISSSGGPLGIISLREIVISTDSVEYHKNAISRLPGLISSKDNLIAFTTGPAIRLEKSGTPQISKIVIIVSSLSKAKDFLISKGLQGKSTSNSIFISEKAIFGLQVELTEEK